MRELASMHLHRLWINPKGVRLIVGASELFLFVESKTFISTCVVASYIDHSSNESIDVGCSPSGIVQLCAQCRPIPAVTDIRERETRAGLKLSSTETSRLQINAPLWIRILGDLPRQWDESGCGVWKAGEREGLFPAPQVRFQGPALQVMIRWSDIGRDGD